MVKCKIGADIKTYEDVRSLITGMIFSVDNFTKQNILDLVKIFTTGSELVINETKLNEMIDEILELLQIEGYVSCNNGLYTSVDSMAVSFEIEMLLKKIEEMQNQDDNDLKI